MKGLKRIIFFILIALILGGCGKNEILVENEEKQNDFFKNTVMEQQVTKEHSPEIYMMGIDPQRSYFLCVEQLDEQEDAEGGYENDSAEESGESDHSYKAYYLCAENLEGKVERILNFPSHPLAMNICSEEKETTILTLSYSNSKIDLYEYNSFGDLKEVVPIQSEAAHAVTEVLKLANGNYVLNCTESLLIIAARGNELAEVSADGGRICRVMSDGEKVIAIMEEGSELSSAELSFSDYRLINRQIISDVKSVYYGMIQKGLLFWNQDGVYIYNNEKSTFEKKVDASEAGIICDRIQSVFYKDGEVQLLSWDYNKAGKKIERICLGESKGQTEQENLNTTRLRVCVAQIMNESTSPLEEYAQEYSLEHPEVDIELECVPADQVSMRMLTEQCPDLLYFMVDSTVEEFQRNGYLSDLLPMLEKSSIEQKGGLSQGIKEAFGFEGALYFVPEEMQVYTLCYIDDDIKEDTPGWTVEEYLTWLETHQGAKNCYFSQRAQIGAVIMGNLDAYVDPDTFEVHFDTEEFKNTLRRIKDIKLSEEMTFESDLEQQDDYIYAPSLYGVANLADMQSYLETPVRVKGFPNDQGKPVHFLTGVSNYAIPRNSQNKELAWEFLEYILLSPEASLDYMEKEGILSNGTLYAVDEFMQKSMELSIGTSLMSQEGMTEYEYTAKEEDKDRFLEIFQASTREEHLKRMVLDIVVEEAMQYFEGKADLDTVVNVIQNRADIFVQEQK